MKNKKKGFTVVELVIVIAVIGILSAILIPTFVGLTKRAQDAALQENLRNAYVAYTADQTVEAGNIKAEDQVYVVVVTVENNEEVKTAYQINAGGVWEVNENAVLNEQYKHGPYNENYFVYEIVANAQNNG